MASNGIRDRVAIVGMGCTSFGERWDKSVSDLLVESSQRSALQRYLGEWVPQLAGIAAPRSLRWALDVDPLEVF